MDKNSEKILTGIKPTGHPHIGNYAGMIRPSLDLIKSNKCGKNYIFIANYHALNIKTTASKIREYTFELVACFLAFGLDSQKVNFYRQSDVPEVFELSTVLSSVTPKGLMNRAHAYKAAADYNMKKLAADRDNGINMGLFTYPILMAADILLFNATLVPVGKDQIQHVEFARDIAGYFNRKYETEFFKLPSYSVQKSVETVVGLDGRKMSKSYGNTLQIFDDPQKNRKLISKIVTDSKAPEDTKDADSSVLFQIYQSLSNADEAALFRLGFESGGLGYGEAKRILADKFEEVFYEPSQRYQEFISDKGELERIMYEASRDVRDEAGERIAQLRCLIGT